jgi:hypothetical protein
VFETPVFTVDVVGPMGGFYMLIIRPTVKYRVAIGGGFTCV